MIVSTDDGRKFVVRFCYPHKHNKHNDLVACEIRKMVTIEGESFISTRRTGGTAKYNLSNESRHFDKGYGRRIAMTRAFEEALINGSVKPEDEGYFWAEYKLRHADTDLEIDPNDLHH